MVKAILGVLVLAACGRGASSPEQALARTSAAIAAGDTAALASMLDRPTTDSITATFKYQQRCLAEIEESYPPDVQSREKARFVDADDVASFLAAYEARYHLMAGLHPVAGDFVKQGGHYTYAGLRARWEDIKLRASHDAETVRESALAYKKAGH